MQLIEQPVDRHLVELLLVERIDVEVGDPGQHVVEQPGLLVHRARGAAFPLQQPAARRQGHAGDDRDDRDVPMLHDIPRSECVLSAMTSRQAASWTACFERVASRCTTPGPLAA